MKAIFNSAVTTFENVKRSFYCIQLMAIVIAIPLLTYLQITHGENSAAKSTEVSTKMNTVPKETAVQFQPLGKTANM